MRETLQVVAALKNVNAIWFEKLSEKSCKELIYLLFHLILQQSNICSLNIYIAT